MAATTGRLSFGIKTSQAGIGYDDILRIWREADSMDVIEHAWRRSSAMRPYARHPSMSCI